MRSVGRRRSEYRVQSMGFHEFVRALLQRWGMILDRFLRPVTCLVAAWRSRRRLAILPGFTGSPFINEQAEDSDHADTRGELRRVVSTGHRRRGPRGDVPCARLHDHPALGLLALGEHAARARRHVQGDGARQRLFPVVHTALLLPEGGRARGRLRERVRSGHAPSARGRSGRQARARGRARGAARRAADVRDDHRRRVLALGAELSRPAAAHQSVGERRALGDAHAAVPAHDGVPLAGGPHRARDTRRGGRGDDADARRLHRLRGRAGWPCP